MYLNHVFLAGNLTRDPEVVYYEKDKKVTRFSVAINKSFKDSSGKEKKDVCFADIVCFDSQAESCAKYLKKGDNVHVEGELQTRKWETNEGEKRSKLGIKAKRVQFLGKFDLKDKI